MQSLIKHSRRNFSSNWTFQKGKLSFQKLKDKVTLDEKIDQINLVFPDQFGRLNGLKLNAEYFIEEIETSQKSNKKPFFEFKFNPFRFDIHGKRVEMPEGFSMPKDLSLCPDFNTLRDVSWQKKEAIVLADIYHPDSQQPLEYSPRHMAQEAIKKVSGVDSHIQFSFNLHKIAKEEKELHHQSNKGMLTLDQGWGEVLSECKSSLLEMGIPVQSKDQTQVNNQFRFSLRKVQNDLLHQCDVYHIAKHAIKFVGYSHQYDIASLPMDSKGQINDLFLTLSGSEIHETQLQNVIFFTPNINSIRRIKKRKGDHFYKKTKAGETQITLAAPDANLYLIMATLFSTQPKVDYKLILPKTYAEAIIQFESLKDSMPEIAYQYYHSLFAHECKEFEEQFSKWESNRIY